MKYLLTIICAACLLTACHHHDEEPEPVQRAVLVYMAADNNLSGFTSGDIHQMMKGSELLTPNQKLLLFIDKLNQPPYVLEVAGGDTTRLNYKYKEDLRTSDAETLGEALRLMRNRYPQAESYGLVLWGHATGWEIKDEGTASARANGPRRAYGYDGTYGGHWLEIPDMAKVLSEMPQLEFIFADCCAFQCIESAYELRHATKYIIASAAEIPGDGAPYQTITPALFSTSENFYETIVDEYFKQEIAGLKEPLSVIKTIELENLAAATHDALVAADSLVIVKVNDSVQKYPNVKGLIYYYDQANFDMQDAMMRYVTDSAAYATWKEAYDKAVVYKSFVPYWMTANHVSFFDFEATEERYGGVSMFVPQDPSSRYKRTEFFARMNRTINRMEWYNAVGLIDFGW